MNPDTQARSYAPMAQRFGFATGSSTEREVQPEFILMVVRRGSKTVSFIEKEAQP